MLHSAGNRQARQAMLANMTQTSSQSAAGARIMLGLLALWCFGTAATAAEAIVGKVSPGLVRDRVVELVNEARGRPRHCGRERFGAAPPLAVSKPLEVSASRHARDMLKKKYFDHRGSDGSQPRDRVMRAGYRYRLTGENIAKGPQSAEEVVAGWLDSPGHCANIMDSRFQHIGVALSAGKRRGEIYWVQNFGAPR